MSTNIRLGFSTSPHWNPLSAAIRAFTGGETTHAYFVYFDTLRDSEVVMEASWAGYRDISYSRWKLDNKIVAEFAFDDRLLPGLRWATKELGENYDYPGLLGMIPVQIGGWIHQKMKNPFQSASSSFCSEICCRAMQESGIEYVTALDPGSTSPQALMDLCIKAGEKRYFSSAP